MPCEITTLDWADYLIGLSPLEDLAVMQAARQGLLDYLACAVGGSTDPGLKVLLKTFGKTQGDASLIGHTGRFGCEQAALLNGYSGHALDYDDVQRSVRGHPSTVLLPALLALAQSRRLSAARLLGAYAVGVEAMGRLGLALGGAHYEAGYHNTATLGTVASAAACSWLLGLDTQRFAVAVGIAATQAAGLRLQFGSQVKPLHAGLAARNGLSAALLAEAGLEGATESLGGAAGFLTVYGQGQDDAKQLIPAHPSWQILQPGLIFKRYASCAATHHAADAALDLQHRHALQPGDIERLRVIFPPRLTSPLSKVLPQSRAAGRFSVEYVVAHALVHGHLQASAFVGDTIDHATAALMRRVEVIVDDSAPPISLPPFARFSTLQLEVAGQHFQLRVDAPAAGVPQDKFIAAFADHDHAQALLEQIGQMHSADDLQRLLRALEAPYRQETD